MFVSSVYFRPYAAANFYQRALLANALTSALRLHQRLPRFQLSRAFLAQALQEDSCHYLLYSLILVNSYPITSILSRDYCLTKKNTTSSLCVQLQREFMSGFCAVLFPHHGSTQCLVVLISITWKCMMCCTGTLKKIQRITDASAWF